MKLRSLFTIICLLSSACMFADTILDPENKPRRHQANNVIDMAEETDIRVYAQ